MNKFEPPGEASILRCRPRMARTIRFYLPDGIYFVTNRCFQCRFLILPSVRVNGVIGGVLAHAIRRFDVEVFAFAFLGNHFHILLRSRHENIPAFMQYLLSNIAKKLGKLVHWHGKFWDRRYDAQPVLDDAATIGRLRYILAHGVKENLVATARDWPGLTCLPELVDGAERSFAWPRLADADALDAPKDVCPLRLAVLPCWEHLDADARSREVRALVADIEREAREARGGRAVLGVAAILAQSPHSKPVASKRSPRPLCHASTKAAREAYELRYRAFVDAYREASALYRAGVLDVEFPLHAYRPPWVRPRLSMAA